MQIFDKNRVLGYKRRYERYSFFIFFPCPGSFTICHLTKENASVVYANVALVYFWWFVTFMLSFVMMYIIYNAIHKAGFTMVKTSLHILLSSILYKFIVLFINAFSGYKVAFISYFYTFHIKSRMVFPYLRLSKCKLFYVCLLLGQCHKSLTHLWKT